MLGKKIKKEVKIGGMHCSHCAAKVEAAIGEIEGVKSVKADPAKGIAVITSTAEIDEAQIKAAIEKAGFEVL